jgi:hypothetical protein
LALAKSLKHPVIKMASFAFSCRGNAVRSTLGIARIPLNDIRRGRVNETSNGQDHLARDVATLAD